MTPKRFQRRAPVKGTHNRIYVGALAVAAGSLYVAVKTISESHRRNESLSLNCLNSSVWSDRSSVMARSKALSCSIRAFCWSELAIAFWYALSPATFAGSSSAITFSILSWSFHSMLPKWSLKSLMMIESLSISGSGFCPPPSVGTGPISASSSGSWMSCTACFSTR